MDTTQTTINRLKELFSTGVHLTTLEGNKLANTVDFRKYVSVLRQRGFKINSYWIEKNGKRFKTYFRDMSK